MKRFQPSQVLTLVALFSIGYVSGCSSNSQVDEQDGSLSHDADDSGRDAATDSASDTLRDISADVLVDALEDIVADHAQGEGGPSTGGQSGDGGDSQTDAGDFLPPSVSSVLYGGATGCSIVSVSWSGATDTGGSGLKGYNVYRDDVLLKHVAAPVTHTMDAGLSASASYAYSVSAVDRAGNESAKSAPLVVTTGSECTEWAELFHVGARYPGASLAPIKSPYVIFGYALGYHTPAKVKQDLPSITAVDRWVKEPTDYQSWTKEGILFLARASSERPDPPYCNQTDIDTEYETLFTDYGFANTGIAIDEFGSESKCITYSHNTLRKLASPTKNSLVVAWFYENRPALAEGLDVVDVFVAEAYSKVAYSVFMEKMISTSESLGLDGKTIMGFGVGKPYPDVQPSDIDAQLTKLRTLSPRLASNGVGFYYLSDNSTLPQWKQYNSVLESHFLLASPTVEITAPHDGDSIGDVTHVTCSASQNAKTKSPIDQYRFFVDDILVEVSKSPSFSWDPGGYSKGEHVLTVHAVAKDYRAGVSQIRVTVK